MSREDDGAVRWDPGTPETTFHVRRAVIGNAESQAWVVEHFHALLLCQARYRLGGRLTPRYDPEDLVQQVWKICLPRLDRIRPRNGRMTPVLVKFLSNVLLQDYMNLAKKHYMSDMRDEPGDVQDLAPSRAPVDVDASPSMLAAQRETVRVVGKALDAMPDSAREILVLRGIEQLSYAVISAKLDVAEGALRERYRRALQKLRGALPQSILDEFSGEEENAGDGNDSLGAPDSTFSS